MNYQYSMTNKELSERKDKNLITLNTHTSHENHAINKFSMDLYIRIWDAEALGKYL